MENNTVLPEKIQAKYDDKRFPKIWHAVLGGAVMYIPVYTVVFLLAYLTGSNYQDAFRTEFGGDMFSAILSQFFAVIIIPVILMLITKRDIISTIRLKKNIDVLQVLLLSVFAVCGFFLLQTINGIFITIVSGVLGEPSNSSSIVDATNPTQLLFEIVIIGGLPAIFEEIFYRGFVMRAFERKSRIMAILMSSLMFAIMHGNLQQLAYAFVCGIILGTVVTLTDSLLAGCVIHFTLNTISVIISYPPINDLYVLYAEKYMFIFSSVVLLVLPVFACGALALFIIYTLKKNKKLYGSRVPTDLKHPKLMPKETKGERVIKTISWIAFIVINVLFMALNWFDYGA